MKSKNTYVVDVWSGPNHMYFTARFLRPLDEALEIAKTEVLGGFLVNIREECTWGPEIEFDHRPKKN